MSKNSISSWHRLLKALAKKHEPSPAKMIADGGDFHAVDDSGHVLRSYRIGKPDTGTPATFIQSQHLIGMPSAERIALVNLVEQIRMSQNIRGVMNSLAFQKALRVLRDDR